MLGRKLAERLARDGTLGGEPIAQPRARRRRGAGAARPLPSTSTRSSPTWRSPESPSDLVSGRPDVVFHLAAVALRRGGGGLREGLSRQPRRDASAVRRDPRGDRRLPPAGRLRLVDRRLRGAVPRRDRRRLRAPTPLTSYGTQKAIGELLLSDYTRRGFLDGVGIRLPTICVRPGAPNRAASGFFSSIIREPLNGQEAVLPVPDDVRHWHASPRAAVGFLLHAATIDERRARRPPLPDDARRLGDRGRADRGVAQRRGRRGRPADPTRARRDRERGSSPAGRAASTRSARTRSGSARSRASTRSSASTSRTSSAGGSRR